MFEMVLNVALRMLFKMLKIKNRLEIETFQEGLFRKTYIFSRNAGHRTFLKTDCEKIFSYIMFSVD